MLFAVFTGKISLIGPSLIPKENSDMLIHKYPYYEYRWAVKPGLISNASLTSLSLEGYSKNILEIDLQYLEQMSVLADTKIFFTAIGRLSLRVLS
jgi:lipopolysaccharide/colanic/teichoic acid biosynthesis glycosyltransferase